MVFHWVLSGCKSLQVSMNLCSVLADLSNAVVWMASTCRVISKSSSTCSNPSLTVPRAPITVGIVVTSCSTVFFQIPSEVLVFSLLFAFFQFYSVVSRDTKFTIRQVLHFLFFCCWLLLGLVVCPRLRDPFVNLLLQDRFWVVHMPFETNAQIYYYSYHYHYYLKDFHTGVSWWSFTGVSITVSFLKSPGLFSVF